MTGEPNLYELTELSDYVNNTLRTIDADFKSNKFKSGNPLPIIMKMLMVQCFNNIVSHTDLPFTEALLHAMKIISDFSIQMLPTLKQSYLDKHGEDFKK